MRIVIRSLCTLALCAAPLAPATTLAQAKVSAFGQYRGWSPEAYDGWQRTSRYITMRDGTKLAIDIMRPTKGGVLHTEKLPIIWTQHRYHRASVLNDTLHTIVEWTPTLPAILKHGYVVAAVDTRGGGASYGVQRGFFSPEETRDAYEITEWLAKLPYVTGKVGMYGRSYLGITQYLAASEHPPHLVTIVPEMAVFDWYPFMYPGGIYRDDFFAMWQKLTHGLDRPEVFTWTARHFGPVAKTDDDSSGALRAGAFKLHETNWNIHDLWASVPYRNSVEPRSGKRLFDERSPHSRLAAINSSKVSIYTVGGWYDAFPKDATLWFRNLRVPQKLMIGPWFHPERKGFDNAAEQLRWYDYWLKGIDNGVMKDPPIHYWVLNAPAGTEWRSATKWPLPTQQQTSFYFGAGKSGSIASANDGTLSQKAPSAADESDAYTVDYTTTSGRGSRWASTYGGPGQYPDLAPNDRKALTYTTAPLERDMEVTGHPVVHLFVSSSAKDGDFFAYLEDVDASGKSSYVTEGVLRASRRGTTQAPYDDMGLPFHRGNAADSLALPASGAELAFDLHPTSILFRKGHRIRVTIAGADSDNTLTPKLQPPPTVRVHRGKARASHLVLPVIPAK